MSKTKGELVAAAFRKAQISGITSQPTGDELAGAMETLEDMMRELDSKNACVNYEYEDEPCLGTESGLESKWYHAVQSRLAVLLCSDYGIEPSQTLMAQSRQAWSSMIGKLTLPRQNAHLAGSEVITSYQIKEQSSGITLSSQQLGEDAQSVELVVIGKRAGTQSLIIEITTSLGRVYPEKVWFTVEEL